MGLPQVVTAKSINIYPNPANNTLNIDLPQAGKHHVSVISITGQVLLQRDVVDAHNTLNIALLPGMYIVQVRGDRENVTQQFIKR